MENELYFSNYASKADLKNATGADTSKQANLATKGDIGDFVKKNSFQ